MGVGSARPTDQQGGAMPLLISAEEHLCHDSPLINLRLRSSSQKRVHDLMLRSAGFLLLA